MPTEWITTIDELVKLFGSAMHALIPVMEKARIPWKEPDAYDDWDQVCASIYNSIVRRSIEYAAETKGCLPISDYDKRVASYDRYSFISDAKSGEKVAFISFGTNVLPFDQCLFAVLDKDLKVVGTVRSAAADVKFILGCRGCDDGGLRLFDELIIPL